MDDAFRCPAVWYDGRTALRRDGTAQWDGGNRLTLSETEGGTTALSIGDLAFHDTRPDGQVYRHAENDGFRLTLPRDLPPGLAARMPATGQYGGWIDRIGLGKAALGFGLASAAVLAIGFTAPEWLGPLVPYSWEQRMGDAMIGDMGNRLCHTPEGDAALEAMVDRVNDDGDPIRFGVANSEMVNAVALPGGRVLLFDGLVQEAESAEELTGILAHEIGHVRERHVMTALLRQFGLAILTTGVDTSVGSSLLGVASMSYSRAAEREADEWARAAMAEGNVSPLGAARFFERLLEEGADTPRALTWLGSHPAQGERAEAFRNAGDGAAAYRPVLSDEQFAAIKRMCEADPDVEAFELM